MRLKITELDLLTFNNLKGKMLLLSNVPKLYVIADFKTEVVEESVMKKPSLFKKAVPTVVKQLYLTSVNVHGYHSTGKFIGSLSDESAEWILRRDLYHVRQNWVDFNDQLKAFGFKVVEIDPKA
jgi:hypothetical protein